MMQPQQLPGGQFNATAPVAYDGQVKAVQAAGGGDIAIANRVSIVSSSFTRPNNSTPYVIGSPILNSTVAGSVVLPSFQAPNPADRIVGVQFVSLYISGNQFGGVGFDGASVAVYLFVGTTMPTMVYGDGGPFFDASSGVNGLLQTNNAAKPIVGTSGGAFAIREGLPNIASAKGDLPVAVGPGISFWWTLWAQTAVTPLPNQTFTAQFSVMSM